ESEGERGVAWSNGGHAAPLLWTGATALGAAMQQLKATGPAVGMFPPGTEFESRSAALGPSAHLLVYSDGAFEVEGPDGAMWKHAHFVEFVAGLPRDAGLLSERLLAHVRQRRGGAALADDFSVLEVRF